MACRQHFCHNKKRIIKNEHMESILINHVFDRIKFPKEENNNLDILIRKENNAILQTQVYRKANHTIQIFRYNSKYVTAYPSKSV